MQFAGFILGLISIIGWAIALIPLLGWMNWIFIPSAVLGLIFSVTGITISRSSKGVGIAAIILCLIVIIFGALRLKIGCGVI
jgi:hypothetical protein